MLIGPESRYQEGKENAAWWARALQDVLHLGRTQRTKRAETWWREKWSCLREDTAEHLATGSRVNTRRHEGGEEGEGHEGAAMAEGEQEETQEEDGVSETKGGEDDEGAPEREAGEMEETQRHENDEGSEPVSDGEGDAYLLQCAMEETGESTWDEVGGVRQPAAVEEGRDDMRHERDTRAMTGRDRRAAPGEADEGEPKRTKLVGPKRRGRKRLAPSSRAGEDQDRGRRVRQKSMVECFGSVQGEPQQTVLDREEGGPEDALTLDPGGRE